MNRYILIRRLRGPAFLLLVGIMALLSQAHILSWGKSWPLYLILGGVLLLAERAALAAEGYPPYPGAPYSGTPYPDNPYPGAPYPGAPNPNVGPNNAGTQFDSNAPAGSPSQPGTAIVPSRPNDFGGGPSGGQQ
ncbi:MAG TPA: hypothetical protein VGG26_02090 [Terracidiphilus sp.]|jgi:hypothetical protein